MTVTLARMGTDTQDESQPTRPKKGRPVEIPVPKRGDVMADLAKVAPPVKPPAPADD